MVSARSHRTYKSARATSGAPSSPALHAVPEQGMCLYDQTIPRPSSISITRAVPNQSPGFLFTAYVTSFWHKRENKCLIKQNKCFSIWQSELLLSIWSTSNRRCTCAFPKTTLNVSDRSSLSGFVRFSFETPESLSTPSQSVLMTLFDLL